jgi:hypothetical protein
MRRFQLLSDMHLEFIKRPPKPPVLAPNLVLSGDIGKINTSGWRQFIEYCAGAWEHIFYVFGNHEFYHSSKCITQLKSDYVNFFSRYPNIHLLDNSGYNLDGLAIYGFVGWTRSPFESVTLAQQEINDYNYIRESKHSLITPEYITKLANQELGQFVTWVGSQTSPCLVITHFPPICANTSNPVYLAQPRLTNNYFAWDNLVKSEQIDPTKIHTWVSGHTHWSYDFIDPGTKIRYVSNQMGYLNEVGESNFNPGLVIEI